MSKSASLFRKNDVKRAFEAAASAGVKVSVEIDRAGKLRLVPLNDAASAASNPWDTEDQIDVADKTKIR